MENFLPFIWMWPRVFCQFQEYCGQWGWWKGRHASTFPGTYSKLPGWPGSSHSCSAQSAPWRLMHKSTFRNRPRGREASGLWGSGRDTGPAAWLKHHVCSGDFSPITPCLGAAILCGESILGGYHLVSPPMPLSPCLDPCALDHLYGFVYTEGSFR